MNFLSKRVTAKRVNYHPVHLMRKVKAGEFPAPVRLSAHKIAFVEDEVTAWQDAKVAVRDAEARTEAACDAVVSADTVRPRRRKKRAGAAKSDDEAEEDEAA